MRKCSFLIPIVSFHKMWQIVSLAGTWSHCNTPVQSRKTTLHYNLQFTWLIYYYITYILICTLVFHSWLTAYIICDIYESVLVFHLDDNDESQLRYVTVIKWVVLCGLSRRVEVLINNLIGYLFLSLYVIIQCPIISLFETHQICLKHLN